MYLAAVQLFPPAPAHCRLPDRVPIAVVVELEPASEVRELASGDKRVQEELTPAGPRSGQRLW